MPKIIQLKDNTNFLFYFHDSLYYSMYLVYIIVFIFITVYQSSL